MCAISYRKPPGTCIFTGIFLASSEGWTLENSINDREREAGSEIMMRLPEKTLAIVRGYKKASKIIIFIFLYDQAA